MKSEARCQTIVLVEESFESFINNQSPVAETAQCPNTATHRVHGLPGNPWSGLHCDEHTKAMVLNYDHQGGCVVRSFW